MSKKDNELYYVGGFSFFSEQEAEIAKKELEGIKYVKGKLDMEQPERVLQLYNKMADEKLFVTAVGIAYLADLREYLESIPMINREDIHPIYVSHPAVEDVRKEQKQKVQEAKSAAKKAATPKKGNVLERKLKFSHILNIILLVCIILMFVIAGTSKHPTILNYETQLINRYSVWEQELMEREAAIREWEQNH